MRFSLTAIAAALSLSACGAFHVAPSSTTTVSTKSSQALCRSPSRRLSPLRVPFSFELCSEAPSTLGEDIAAALEGGSSDEEASPAGEESGEAIVAAVINGEKEGDEAATNGEKEAEVEDEWKLELEEAPAASYSISSTPSAPGGGLVHTLSIQLGQPGTVDPIVIETGKIGRQAAAAVTLTRGKSVLYATASRDDEPKEKIDFLPLSVEHQERFSSAGLTSGSFNKRDGRPGEHEILVCRLIDRPLRPLIAEGWRHETQLLSWVLSYDGVKDCDSLAITASAAALWLSDVPLSKPVAAATVGYIDGQLVLNPTVEQMERSRLNLTIAGTKDAVLMIEGAADFLPEALMIEAVSFGHDAVKVQCEGLEALGALVGKEKRYDTIPPPVDGLEEQMVEMFSDKVDQLFDFTAKKEELSDATSKLSKEAKAYFEDIFPEQGTAVKAAWKALLCKRMFAKAKESGKRVDGRNLDEVRQIDADAGLFPRVHGSALFTRGQTQVVATATLGDSGMKQKMDGISGMKQKRFYLQYTFPPSCVGETGRVGMPGRREVGHGNLAERALIPTLPTEEEFPYTIRVESLVTESNGSSSMASVCGGCLALMDAGVPIKSPIAGIAMGMLLGDNASISDADAVIISDLLGTEDALGTMDFKVAGDREGITTFQLDIKCEGLQLETMARALEQAKVGRLHILDEMEKALKETRSELPSTVPKIGRMSIDAGSIGKVIGPGGKQIRAIIEDFELVNMNVAEDGGIQLTAFDTEKMEKAKEFITTLTADGGGRGGGRGGGGGRERTPRPEYVGPEPEVGKQYKGKITGIHNFGVFLEILPGAEDGSTPGLEGLCHVSELHTERIRNCEGFVGAMNSETLDVIYQGLNNKGKHQLSRKAVLEAKFGGGKMTGNRGGPSRSEKAPSETKSEAPPMSEEEIDIIAQAIEGVSEL